LSFRNRLILFFVVIVIVPMIAVAVVLFRLISDSQSGKADAAVAARAQTATRVYEQDAGNPAAARAAARVATDRVLGQALRAGRPARARRRAQQLVTSGHAIRIVLMRGTATVLDTGQAGAVAPVTRDLVQMDLRPLGRLMVSVTSASAYGEQVRALTGLQVIVRQGAAVLGATLPAPAVRGLPAAGHANHVRLGSRTYRAVTFAAPSFSGQPLQLSLLSEQAGATKGAGTSRLLVGGFLAVFLAIAVFFAVLVSRSLQAQLGGLLQTARRLAAGDFSAQAPMVGSDEFAQLGGEFNKMSGELERRLRELRDQQERLAGAMRAIGDSLASNLDRDALLRILLTTALDGVGASGARAVLVGRSGEMEEQVQVGDLQGAEEALAQVEAVVQGAATAGSVELDGVSALAHPLAGPLDGGALGVLSIVRRDGPFLAAERELFGYLAGQAAVSLENLDLHERVQRQAVTDGLTGLYNHRRFHEAIVYEGERAKRFSQSLGLVMVDIDNFKQINDTHGHPQGDQVLRDVAGVLRRCSREIDSPARYGGEELALLLPGTDLSGAFKLAERLRLEIAGLRLPLPAGNGAGPLKVTASLGVAASMPGGVEGVRELIAAADRALYQAKRSGKNMTVQAQ